MEPNLSLQLLVECLYHGTDGGCWKAARHRLPLISSPELDGNLCANSSSDNLRFIRLESALWKFNWHKTKCSWEFRETSLGRRR